MNEELNPNNLESENYPESNGDNDYKNLINRLREIKTTIALLEKTIFIRKKNFSALLSQKYGSMILMVHNFEAITLTSNTRIYQHQRQGNIRKKATGLSQYSIL